MAVHLCGTCGQVRARVGEDICPVCWLVRELRREHDDGEHTAINSSCVDCTRTLTKKQFRDLIRVQPTVEKKKSPRKPRAVPSGYIDHSACGHLLTPSARAKCRAKHAAK